MKITFVVDGNLHGKTLLQYFEQNQYSTTQIKRMKYNGNISVNGQTVTVRYTLKEGDKVLLESYEQPQTPQFAQNKAQIVFADGYLYVAEKPFGVAIHPDRAHTNETFGNMLATTFGQGFSLHLVTRLDKTTQGLVLGALDQITAERLNRMMFEHQIHKTYLAVVCGCPEQQSGTIDACLSRDDATNKTIVDSCGKQAVTTYKVIAKYDNFTLMELSPLTGRTHQLRAHMAHIGCPIVGDKLYGAYLGERIMLCCHKLRFFHPYTKEEITVVSNCNWQQQVDIY